MTFLGLSKTWIISIVFVIILIVGAGFVGLITTGLVVFNLVSQVPASPTTTVTTTPVITGTLTDTPPMSATVSASPTVTGTLAATVTPDGTLTPVPPGAPVLVFQQVVINVTNLCRGAYVTQTVLVNRGPSPVVDQALVWRVVQGAEFVKAVRIESPSLVIHNGSADLLTVTIEPELNLDVQIEVNKQWWTQPDGTEIKVELSLDDSSALLPDVPGSDTNGNQSQGTTQIITIVKQGSQWVTLTGLAYEFGQQTLLIDGQTVLINECTLLPPTLPPSGGVQVIGMLQPNGTFIAINITIVDINVIIRPPSNPPPSGGGGHGGGGGGRGGDDDDDD